MSEWFKHLLGIVYESEMGDKLIKPFDYVTLPIPVINGSQIFLVVSFCDQVTTVGNNAPFLFAPKATVYINPVTYSLAWRRRNPIVFSLRPNLDGSLGQIDRSHIQAIEEWETIEENFYESLLDLIAHEWMLNKHPDPVAEERVAFDLRATLTILEDDVLIPYYETLRYDLDQWINSRYIVKS